MTGHIFISYSHGQDRRYVERLAAHLAHHGHQVWFDKDIVQGDRWSRVIRTYIDSCAAFIVVMTPEAEQSEWVEREIDQASHTSRPIFPLLLRGPRFFTLANVQYEDVTGERLPSPDFMRRLQTIMPGAGSQPGETPSIHSLDTADDKTADSSASEKVGDPGQQPSKTTEEPTKNAAKPHKPKYRPPRHSLIAASIAVIALAIGGSLLGIYFGSRSDQNEGTTTNPGLTSEISQPTAAQCVGSTCLGKDPRDLGCSTGTQTLIEERLGSILIELRYNATCQAAWGKITGAKVSDMVEVVDQNDTRRSAKVLQNNDKYTPMIPALEGYRLHACVYTTENEHACTKEFEIK